MWVKFSSLKEGETAFAGMKAGDFNMEGVEFASGEDGADGDNGRFEIGGSELFLAEDLEGGPYYVKFSAAGGALTRAAVIFVAFDDGPSNIGFTADYRLMDGTAVFRGDYPVGTFTPTGGKPPYSYSVVAYAGDDGLGSGNSSFRGGADGIYAKAPLTAGATYKVYVRCMDKNGRHYQQGVTVEAKAYTPPEFNDQDFVRFEGGLVEGTVEYNSGVFVDGRNLDIPPFMLSKYEVTQKLWWDVYQWAVKAGAYSGRSGTAYQFATQNPALPASAPSDGDAGKPQMTLSWGNVVKWLDAFSEMRGLTPVYSSAKPNYAADGYRLPSEAEWEYAAKGGVPSLEPGSVWMYRYVGTDDIAEYPKYAVTNKSAAERVGLMRPNTAGLYDMFGNAAEWCNDRFTQYGYDNLTADDVSVWGPAKEGNYHIARGGTFKAMCEFGTLNDRKNFEASGTLDTANNERNIGFRIVRTVMAAD